MFSFPLSVNVCHSWSCGGPRVQYCMGLLATSGCKSGTWLRPARLPTGSLTKVRRWILSKCLWTLKAHITVSEAGGTAKQLPVATSAAAAGATQLRHGAACSREGSVAVGVLPKQRGLNKSKQTGGVRAVQQPPLLVLTSVALSFPNSGCPCLPVAPIMRA